jgi:acetyl-CoA acetyltransferase
MPADSIWVLGIHMTRFAKHKDKDLVDLAAEASLGALADAGVPMSAMQVMACGNLMCANAGLGQQVQKQIGQFGIPVYNVANACATGATALRTVILAIKAGEADFGLAVGVEKVSGAGLLAGATRPEKSGSWLPEGRYGAVTPLDGLVGTETMPGVFAQVGLEYEHAYGGTSAELFARISEKNHAHSTLNPLAAYTRRFTLEEILGARWQAAGQRLGRAGVKGASHRGHRHRQRLRGRDPAARRGWPTAGQRCPRRPHPRDWPRLRVRCAHPGEGRSLTGRASADYGQSLRVG